MRNKPIVRRKTRQFIAKSFTVYLGLIVGWLMLPGDIGPIEQGLAITIVPAIIAGLVAFITNETYNDHSERSNKANNDD